jgi:hypothetical protein
VIAVARFRRRHDDEAQDADPSIEAAAVDEPSADNLGSSGEPVGDHEGPHDVSDPAVDAAAPRVDFGALKVPGIDGMQVRVDADEAGNLIAVTVLIEDTSIQVSAFAAPRTGGLWAEVRTEIAAAIVDSGGRAREEPGRFGVELVADVPVTEPGAGSELEPLRFVGADGARWFARGLIGGPGAHDRSRAAQVEDVFAGLVVDRGDHPAPPREPLPLTLPPEIAATVEEGPQGV